MKENSIKIFEQQKEQLLMLKNLLEQISDDIYQHSSKHLNNSSIGAHTRHIIELLQCVLDGYKTGVVDYINRHRNHNIEVNRFLALSNIESLINNVLLDDKQLSLMLEDNTLIGTTYFREIVYNTEHIIHHLALIKVSLIEQSINIVDDNFGMAYSTIKYKENLQSA